MPHQSEFNTAVPQLESIPVVADLVRNSLFELRSFQRGRLSLPFFKACKPENSPLHQLYKMNRKEKIFLNHVGRTFNIDKKTPTDLSYDVNL